MLNIKGNCITKVGIVELSKVMPNIMSLNFSDNEIGGDFFNIMRNKLGSL